MSYVISNITTRKVTTKFGEKDVYDIHSGSERFSFGFKKPAFKIGDEVNFSVSEDKYGKTVDVSSVRVVKDGGGTVTSAPTEAPKAAYTPYQKVFPIPALHGDRAIIRQNALTNARELFVGRKGYAEPPDSGGTDIFNPEAEASIIISIARIFEAYSAGDSDLAEAMKGVEK